MSSPHTPGSVPPPPPPPVPAPGAADAAPRRALTNDDIPTAPFTAVPAELPPSAGHAPVPPPPDAPAAAPVRRTSIAQRLPRGAAPTSPFAAAAPQPAPRVPYPGIPLQQVSAPAQNDWFDAAAQQQAAPSYAPQGEATAGSYGGAAPAGQYPAAVAPAGYPQATYPQETYPQAVSPQETYPHAAHPQAASPQGYAPDGYAAAGYAPGYAEAAAAGGYAPAEHAYAAQPDAAPRRRRLSPGWVAFIALDVVLLVGVVVFAWNMLTGPVNAPAVGSPTSSTTQDAEASPEPSAPAAPTLAEFASPSGNITCVITTAEVTCGIAQLNQQPAPVDGCDGTVGYRVTVSAETGEVSLPCVPVDQQPQAAPEGTTSLEYTESVTQGQFTCISADTGMSCKDDTSGKGFTIAKAGIGTF
ncbi:hypothetical protein Xcel_1103 [Xylanimonas cellulosilytica DSM 15894]|uniref:Uncharacterized protein n=1 Tax=Xylanimonas cellulosilytica (strain DSM 15894 / JCM 12276 / CECT 5975 / KCTC 9989 / LMG 20990 / NBRC 107835 / XIL07) TaxID=446471 RepID=D1BZI0_XYLCX|nr:hypothetical protein [Xylanimonas cellulosilytica]ACZ30134.1 hypothetical protein Xcel_1103 [Xylanimonas cellulosilytica DSM 15894]